MKKYISRHHVIIEICTFFLAKMSIFLDELEINIVWLTNLVCGIMIKISAEKLVTLTFSQFSLLLIHSCYFFCSWGSPWREWLRLQHPRHGGLLHRGGSRYLCPHPTHLRSLLPEAEATLDEENQLPQRGSHCRFLIYLTSSNALRQGASGHVRARSTASTSACQVILPENSDGFQFLTFSL